MYKIRINGHRKKKKEKKETLLMSFKKFLESIIYNRNTKLKRIYNYRFRT